MSREDWEPFRLMRQDARRRAWARQERTMSTLRDLEAAGRVLLEVVSTDNGHVRVSGTRTGISVDFYTTTGTVVTRDRTERYAGVRRVLRLIGVVPLDAA